MELKELKLAWKELNENVKKNELTNRSVILKMLTRQKETSMQRVWRFQLSSVGIMVILWACIFYLYRMQWLANAPWLFYWNVLLAVVITVSGVMGISKVKKIKDGVWDLELQLKRILNYKVFLGWTFVISYSLIFPVFILVLYYYYNLFLLLVLCVIVPVAVSIDVFIYHYMGNMLKNISETSKELEQLKSESL